MKFKEMSLKNETKHALSEMGLLSPLPVQLEAIPLIMSKKDLVVSAPTGSGKTAAYAIPLIEQIDIALPVVQVVVLVPTRELAEQVAEEFLHLGRYHEVRVLAMYGKQPIEIQRKALKKAPHVIVATPGRLLDHLNKRNLKLSDVFSLVLDEADEMLLMGFEEQIEAIVKRMPEKTHRTTHLFSATMPQEVIYLSERFQNSPDRVEIAPDEAAFKRVEQLYYQVDGLKKVDFLREMLRRERPQKAVIFCNTQNQVERLYGILRKDERLSGMLHGGMDQMDRQQTITAFKKGDIKRLITTDLGGRGLHVEGLTHVVNYSVPFEHEQYIHRIGRTGRVMADGVAITLVIPSEQDRFNALQKYLGYSIPCKGGHIARPNRLQKDESEASKRKKRYSATANAGGEWLKMAIEVNKYGIKKSDVISAIRGIDGVHQQDIGRLEFKEHYILIEVLNQKGASVLKGLRDRHIKGKGHRIKRHQ